MKAKFFLIKVLFLLSCTTNSVYSTQEVSDLKDFNPAFSLAPLVKIVENAIVSIQVSVKKRSDFFDFNDPFLEFFFGNAFNIPQTYRETANGSGCIISLDGTILTCAHVIKNATKIQIKLKDGKVFDAKVVSIDDENDLALLKIKSDQNFSFVKLGDSDSAQVGDRVIAGGYPFGVRQTITSGIISGKGQLMDGKTLLQTDAAVNPGNSGGGLFNMKGELIAIPNAIYSKTGSFHGIGYAIPSIMAKAMIKQSKESYLQTKSDFGFETRSLQKDHLKAMNINGIEHGELVSNIDQSGHEKQDGLLQNDIIIAINGKLITSGQDFKTRLELIQKDEEVTFTVIRNGLEEDISYKPRLMESKITTTFDFNKKEAGLLQGLSIGEIVKNKDQRQVVVTNINPQLPVNSLGLKQGDIIKSINGNEIKSLDDFQKIAENDKAIANKLSIEFQRKGNTITSSLFVN